MNTLQESTRIIRETLKALRTRRNMVSDNTLVELLAEKRATSLEETKRVLETIGDVEPLHPSLSKPSDDEGRYIERRQLISDYLESLGHTTAVVDGMMNLLDAYHRKETTLNTLQDLGELALSRYVSREERRQVRRAQAQKKAPPEPPIDTDSYGDISSRLTRLRKDMEPDQGQFFGYVAYRVGVRDVTEIEDMLTSIEDGTFAPHLRALPGMFSKVLTIYLQATGASVEQEEALLKGMRSVEPTFRWEPKETPPYELLSQDVLYEAMCRLLDEQPTQARKVFEIIESILDGSL